MKVTFFDFMNIPEYDCETPYTKGIGGTQSAICYYAEELAKSHDVSVYLLNIDEEKTNRGVKFMKGKDIIKTGLQTDILVWSSSATETSVETLKNKVVANLKICWIPHNLFEPGIDDFETFVYYFDLFGFVSEHQRKQFIETYNLNVEKTFVFNNGICPSFQTEFDPSVKKPYFIYTSQPYRGLEIVANNWSKIVEKYPEAQLHTYSSRSLYGGINSDETNVIFEKLKTLSNVFVHDPVGQADLVKICHEASFFAYPTDFIETGCIAATEASAGGCIPIVSNLGCLGSYFDDCLIYNDTLDEQFVDKSLEYLDLYYNKRDEFNMKSLGIGMFFQRQRDYKLLAEIFTQNVEQFLIRKKQSVDDFKTANALFDKKKYFEASMIYANMIPYFESKDQAYFYYLNKGASLFYLQKYKNAIINFEKAGELKMDLQLCINMILASEKIGNKEKTLKWCEHALKFKFNLEIIYKILDLVQKRTYFERTKWAKYLLSLWNDDIDNINWLKLFLSHGNMVSGDLATIMKHEECIQQLSNVIEKGQAYALLKKIDLKKDTDIRRYLEKLYSNLFLNLNYYETNNPRYASFIKYYMENLPPMEGIVKPTFTKITNRKIRIGILSGDFIYHPVSYIINGIVKHIDKSKFDVYIFSSSVRDEKSTMQQRLIEDAKEFINIEKKSVQDMKNSIIEKDIDLLIEMCGHTSNGSDLLNVLRHKPARVIAQYFAFPNTYGLPEIDYKIGDDIVFPFGLDRYYNEKFCKVKNGFHTYNPIMPIKVNKKEHEGIVFGCTNNPKKYRPDWIKCVSQILKQVENSKLVLRYFGLEDPSIQEFYWKEFEKHGIERKRIDMDIGASLLKYFESYSNMDICLDPFPYNGGTINIEILYAGLPYVTLLGASYVSRVGASILTQVGHPELIAKTQEQYVNMAVGLAKDSERLKKYKETLREDFDKSTLGDNKAFTQNFEDSVMWMLRDSEKIPTEFKFPEVEVVESIPKLVISEKF